MTSFDPMLVFDIETVPDVAGGRRILGLDGFDDADVRTAMISARMQSRGTDFQPAHLQRVVAISVALRSGEDSFKCWTLGDEDADEAEIIKRFYDGVERYRPQLVSWNGSGFDLPVLHYRAMLHGIAAPAYWDTGARERESKYNNYLSRYHERHLDLMDYLALYNGRNYAPLTEIAVLLGFPGKLGMDGSKVAQAFDEGRIREIREYCETDVLNTWLVTLRFLRLRGQISAQDEAVEHERAKAYCRDSGAVHWKEFVEAWEAAA